MTKFAMIPFAKYHGLGNSYLVVDGAQLGAADPAELARGMCDVNYGIGSDGLLISTKAADAPALRIFNPDGSEAEKSGNGLRIFARWLWDGNQVCDAPFTVKTASGAVQCQVLQRGAAVRVEMGKVSVREPITLDVTCPGSAASEKVTGTIASVGNPHFVLLQEHVSPQQAKRLGPLIETHAHFPKRTNVQFVRVDDAHAIHIEIWERGAGYTASSGSSSCAAAAVCLQAGLCQSPITVHMPGGELTVQFSSDQQATLIGPVQKIASGNYAHPSYITG